MPRSQVTGTMVDNDDAVDVCVVSVLLARLVVRPSLQMPLFASGQESSHMNIFVDVPRIQGGCLPGGRVVDGEEVEEEGLALSARRDDCERWGNVGDRDPVAGFPKLLFSRPYLTTLKNKSAYIVHNNSRILANRIVFLWRSDATNRTMLANKRGLRRNCTHEKPSPHTMQIQKIIKPMQMPGYIKKKEWHGD